MQFYFQPKHCIYIPHEFDNDFNNSERISANRHNWSSILNNKEMVSRPGLCKNNANKYNDGLQQSIRGIFDPIKNVNTAVQCTGSATNALVTLSNVVSTDLPAASTIMFSINNFNSPPTNQAVDAVVVTTYTSTGASIDQCTAYVTGLVAKTIPSSQFTIA